LENKAATEYPYDAGIKFLMRCAADQSLNGGCIIKDHDRLVAIFAILFEHHTA
jgi:hypothetical protein